LTAARAQPKVAAPRIWAFEELDGRWDEDRFQRLTAGPVMFDAVYVPGGEKKKIMMIRKALRRHEHLVGYMDRSIGKKRNNEVSERSK
jgi:hypothetical protein